MRIAEIIEDLERHIAKCGGEEVTENVNTRDLLAALKGEAEEDAPEGPWEDSELRLPIWLVWQLHTDGRVYLQAVTTNPQLAADYRTGLLKSETTVRAYVEPRETNHGFGLSMITPLLKNSGDLNRLKGDEK